MPGFALVVPGGYFVAKSTPDPNARTSEPKIIHGGFAEIMPKCRATIRISTLGSSTMLVRSKKRSRPSRRAGLVLADSPVVPTAGVPSTRVP
jgi:hypothetical protein